MALWGSKLSRLGRHCVEGANGGEVEGRTEGVKRGVPENYFLLGPIHISGDLI